MVDSVQRAALQTQLEWAKRLKSRSREQVRAAYEASRIRWGINRTAEETRALADADFERG